MIDLGLLFEQKGIMKEKNKESVHKWLICALSHF